MDLETKLNCSKVSSSGLSVSRYPRYPSLGAARGGARSCGGGSGQAGGSTRGFCAARAPPRPACALPRQRTSGRGGAGRALTAVSLRPAGGEPAPPRPGGRR